MYVAGYIAYIDLWCGFQDQRKRGVIAASAGNHALALAYHCHMLNIECTVVTPVTAPIMKVLLRGQWNDAIIRYRL